MVGDMRGYRTRANGQNLDILSIARRVMADGDIARRLTCSGLRRKQRGGPAKHPAHQRPPACT